MANKYDSMTDLSGELIAGHLQVTHQTAVKRYAVTCQRCNTRMEGYRHDDLLRSPRCHNRGCDRPKPTTLQSFQEEQGRLEAAAREEQERPLREADKKWKKSINELGKATREIIVSGPDPDVYRDPATLGIRMTQEQAAEHNLREVEKFKAEHQDYYAIPSNSKVMLEYLNRNGVGQILSAKALAKAYERLSTYGLLEQRPPVVETEPELLEETIQPEPEPIDDGSEWGWVEGEKVRKSAWAIKQMSSQEYLDFVRIPFSQLVRPVNPVKY